MTGDICCLLFQMSHFQNLIPPLFLSIASGLWGFLSYLLRGKIFHRSIAILQVFFFPTSALIGWFITAFLIGLVFLGLLCVKAIRMGSPSDDKSLTMAPNLRIGSQK